MHIGACYFYYLWTHFPNNYFVRAQSAISSSEHPHRDSYFDKVYVSVSGPGVIPSRFMRVLVFEICIVRPRRGPGWLVETQCNISQTMCLQGANLIRAARRLAPVMTLLSTRLFLKLWKLPQKHLWHFVARRLTSIREKVAEIMSAVNGAHCKHKHKETIEHVTDVPVVGVGDKLARATCVRTTLCA